MRSRYRARFMAAVAAVALAGAMPAVAGTPAQASSCPTVASDGTVTPPPAPGVNWAYCDLTGANLQAASLSAADLRGATLVSADVSGADLSTATIAFADLQNADLSGATLTNADAQYAGLEKTDLSSANLTGANLSASKILDSDIASSDLAGASLSGVYSYGITGTPSALPANWQLVSGYLAGPAADLASAGFNGVSLSGADLAGANLELATVLNTDLAGANLNGADLTQASLRGSDLTSTDMTGTALRGIQSGGNTGNPVGLPAPWVLRDGYFFGPGAYIFGQNLTGLNLTGTDLSGASFFSSNLTGVNLANVNLSGASMLQANLIGADLFGANVTGVNWQGARCPGGSTESSPIRCKLAFRFAGFTSPRQGAKIRSSARTITVRFSFLATIVGAKLTDSIASTLAKARQVRVILTRKGIKPVTAYCNWSTATHQYVCTIRIPRHVLTGASHPYFLTAQEKPGNRFIASEVITRKTPNPLTIYFR